MSFSRLRLKMVRETRGSYGGADHLSMPAQVAAEATRLLEDEAQEVVIAFFLDIKNKVIGWSEIHRGMANTCSVSPKEILRRALVCGATSIVLAHNHPSGDPEPSSQDRAVTEAVGKACDLLDVPLLDHIVVGFEKYVSFKERGWLPA